MREESRDMLTINRQFRGDWNIVSFFTTFSFYVSNLSYSVSFFHHGGRMSSTFLELSRTNRLYFHPKYITFYKFPYLLHVCCTSMERSPLESGWQSKHNKAVKR